MPATAHFATAWGLFNPPPSAVQVFYYPSGPHLDVSQPIYTVSENVGTASVGISLSGTVLLPVSVRVMVSDGATQHLPQGAPVPAAFRTPGIQPPPLLLPPPPPPPRRGGYLFVYPVSAPFSSQHRRDPRGVLGLRAA